MTTALITARRTTTEQRHHTRTAIQVAAMPQEMAQALREFGLMRAFRGLTSTEQRDHICRVIEAPTGAPRRDQIGRLLDELFDDISPGWFEDERISESCDYLE